MKSGALRRGLRSAGCADAATLARWAIEQYARRIEGLLGAAQRSGYAVIGQERVRDAMARREVALLIVAGDAAENREELMRSAERLGGSCLVHADKAELGRLFGRETVAVVAVTERAIAKELQHAARFAAELVAEAS